MKTFTRALVAILFSAILSAILAPGSAGASASGDASRPLNAQEVETFLPLVCARPHKGADGDNHCSKLIGHPSQGDTAFGLTAILYGSFTHAGSDEAYVTFYSPSFAHADNFGGGVLFARSNGSWKLARWFPGWLMDRCAKVPETAPQLTLCVTGFTGQGETTSSVWIWRVPSSGSSLIAVGDQLLSADDTSGVSQEAENGCYSGVPKGRARLTLIESIESSNASPYFALANVTYETGEDIASACTGPHPRKVRTTKGKVRFREAAGKVTAVTPVPFVAVP